jgi:cytochrome c oxidase cbb3-type subunit III
MRKILKYSFAFATLFLLATPYAFAGEAPAPSIFSNPLAVTFIILMLVLLLVIAILANVLLGAADVKRNKRKQERAASVSGSTLLTFLLLLLPTFIFGQDATTTEAPKLAKSIGGMQAGTFYLMVSILFLELLVIITLLLNIKTLLKKEKLQLAAPEELAAAEVEKANKLSWWDRFNALKPTSEEAALDLGHEYDGIRELNNRLPPWWLYCFYLSIIFSIIYLWRFHVSHNGPSSKEEFEISVAKAQLKIDDYLKKKGDNVDENTVTLLTAQADIDAGKAIFTDGTKCPACHGTDGGGNAVGPNLTDDYWLYGGGVKDIFKTIKYGTTKGMRSWKDDLSAKQIAQLTSYIKTLKGTKPAIPKEPQGELYKEEAAPAPAIADTTIKKL